MPRLDIGGTKIDVSDDFLKLSPQAQDAFVKNTIMPSPEFQAAQKTTAPPEPAQPSEPSALSEFGKAFNPVEMARETGRTASEAVDKIEALKGRGTKGPIEGLLDTGSAALAAASIPFALGLGPLKNIIGHGMTGLEHLAGQYINPDAASKDDLQKMYDASRGDVETALSGVRPAGAPVRLPGLPGPPSRFDVPPTRKAFEYLPPPEPPPPAVPPAPEPPPGLEAVQAAQRQGIDVPRVLTTDNRVNQQAGQILAKQPLAGGGQIARAVEDVPVQLGERRNAVADEFGNLRSPENVASDIRQTISGSADAETQAAEQAAKQADETARANWERTNQERQQAIEGYQQRSAQETAQRVGNNPTTDMGDTIIDTVRANHEAVRGAKDAAYADAATREGTLYDPAVGRADRFVTADLRSERGGQGIVETHPVLTPAAHNMREELQAFSERARQRQLAAQQEAIDGGGAAADADPTGLNLRTIERQRQVLNAKAQNATTPGDQRAAGRIMNAFDEWQQRAMGGPHFEGDPDALPAFQRARAANRDFRQRFGYNGRNDADTLLNKIVQPGDQIGSNDIANALTATRGDKPGRLMDAVFQATGDHPNHPNVVQAVRGGIWNKLASGVEGGRPRTAEDIASKIYEFTRGPGRDVAARIYNPEDQALMQRHADVLRAAERARDNTAAFAKANKPVPTEVQKGPIQELADKVLGQKSDEGVFRAIESYAKSKSSKDLKTLSDLTRSLPENLKANFTHNFIRRLGVARDGGFSPAIFENEWRNITPQTKSVLFGNAGAHVEALDDIATISNHYDQVHRRFGNPSGSGHTINFAHGLTSAVGAMLSGTLLGPTATVAGWLGGLGYSKFLSTPQGASSVARFARRMERFQAKPSIENAAAARMSMRNMRNTALSLGIAANIPDELKPK